ncbi:hypothetical protein QTP86_023151, partial [Hemibagrus guttatus]
MGFTIPTDAARSGVTPLKVMWEQRTRVPQLWKTSCIIPVPKKPRPGELNDYRPVALTSHKMKTMERVLLHHMTPSAVCIPGEGGSGGRHYLYPIPLSPGQQQWG